MMKVQAYGSFHMAQAIWSHMKGRGYGRILLTTSGAASFGLAPLAHYCAAKGAVYGLMRSLAVEGEPFGIKVNGLSPSAYTRMVGDNPEIKARMESLMPPELVAPVAAYLVHESCTLNGESAWRRGPRVANLRRRDDRHDEKGADAGRCGGACCRYHGRNGLSRLQGCNRKLGGAEQIGYRGRMFAAKRIEAVGDGAHRRRRLMAAIVVEAFPQPLVRSSPPPSDGQGL
jgi:hypothetical protein